MTRKIFLWKPNNGARMTDYSLCMMPNGKLVTYMDLPEGEVYEAVDLYIVEDGNKLIGLGAEVFDEHFGPGTIIVKFSEHCYTSAPTGNLGSITTPWRRNIADTLHRILGTTSNNTRCHAINKEFIKEFIIAYNLGIQITEVHVVSHGEIVQTGSDVSFDGRNVHTTEVWQTPVVNNFTIFASLIDPVKAISNEKQSD